MKRTSRLVRYVRRACFLAAALLVVAALVVPEVAKAANDPDADRPLNWAGQASASALIATADSKGGVLPVQQPFFAAFPDAGSQWDGNSQYARASTYYPGPTGTGGVALVCGQVFTQIFSPQRVPPNLEPPVCNPAPPFPTVVEADSTKPDARTDGSQVIGQGYPLTITATSAVAHADRVSVYSDAVLGSVNVIGTPAVPTSALAFRKAAASILHGPAAGAAITPQASDNSTLHIDSAVAHTKQTYDNSGALLVTASSTLKGVSLLGGAIQIATIKSDATSHTDGNGIADHSEHFTLGGVTVAGQSATIDQNGVHVGSSSSAAKPLTDALNTALASAGAKVSLASTSGDVNSSDPKTVTSEVQGLNFYIERFLQIPNATDTYFATFTLGVAGTRASATQARNSDQQAQPGGIGGVSTPSDTGSSPPLPDLGTPSSGGPLLGSSGTGASFNSTTTRTNRPRVLGSRLGSLRELEADLVGATISHRFDLLYLACAIAFIGVCLSSRLLVPRPRPSSDYKVL
ncbi:MAG: hypothetical protein JOZ68_01900 [Acidimicrobiia bacterium]|nr:hypothetical protein [Acidimicrobiia bacterium]